MTIPPDGPNPSNAGNSRSGQRRNRRRNRPGKQGAIAPNNPTEGEQTVQTELKQHGNAASRTEDASRPTGNNETKQRDPERPEGHGTHGSSTRSNAPKKRRRSRRPGRPEHRPDPASVEQPHYFQRTKTVKATPSQPNDNRPRPGNQNNHKRSEPRHHANPRHRLPLYAALDLGTNNCRLLIAIPQQTGRFRVVDAYSQIVRLGEGMEASGRLSDDAMDRAIGALKACAAKLRKSNVKRMRLIATEACRRAENGALFIDRVKRETGLELEIVNRKTEAFLAAEGCGELVDHKAEGAVLFDIGGGSSELVLIDRRHSKSRKISDHICSWVSLPVGVVTLSERHGGKQVSPQIFRTMVSQVEEMLADFEDRDTLNRFWSNGRVHLLGTSGTVTTLAGVHLQLPKYDRRQVDGAWLADGDVDRIINQLLAMEFEQRAANPCIGRERADLVLAGCAILQAIRNTWPSPRLRVADRGLREGLLTQMMDQDGAWIRPKKGRRGRNRNKWQRNAGGQS